MDNESTVVINEDSDLPDNLKQVFEIWNALPKEPELPLASNFSLEQIPNKLLPWSVLADVIQSPLDFRFRFWGTERSNLIGAEMTGKYLSEISAVVMGEGNREEYESVCRNREAVICRTPVVAKSGITSTRLSMRLPLSNDGIHVSRIYSAIDPNTVTLEQYEVYGTTPRRRL
jgi:hypothetical protein